MSADEIRGGAVCKKKIELNSTDAASRAAAVAEYVGKEVLMCGGRNRDSQVNEVTISYRVLHSIIQIQVVEYWNSP